jgi:hypothetical protein
MKLKPFMWLLGITLCYSQFLLGAESTNKPSIKILIDTSVTQKTLPAWLAYAGARAAWMEKDFQEQHPEAVEYRYSFEEEIEAREFCLKIWGKSKEKDPKLKDKFLDELRSVQQAGYLREYVWWNYYIREWQPKPEGLDLDGFKKWAATHLKKHTPQTLAIAKFEDQPAPWEHDRDDVYIHRYSRFRFPKTVAHFVRGDPHAYDPLGRDVSMAYDLESTVALTVYIFPNNFAALKSPKDATTAEWTKKTFADEKWELEQVHRLAKEVDERPISIQQASETHEGQEAIYELTDVFAGKEADLQTMLYLFPYVKVFLKIRATFPKRLEQKARTAINEFTQEFEWPKE